MHLERTRIKYYGQSERSLKFRTDFQSEQFIKAQLLAKFTEALMIIIVIICNQV